MPFSAAFFADYTPAGSVSGAALGELLGSPCDDVPLAAFTAALVSTNIGVIPFGTALSRHRKGGDASIYLMPAPEPSPIEVEDEVAAPSSRISRESSSASLGAFSVNSAQVAAAPVASLPVFEETAGVRSFPTFDEMNLSESVLRGLYRSGFESPRPIQRRAIVPIAAGRNVVVQASAGTGKTAAFGAGVLHRIDPSLNCVQAIILSPTLELTDQNFNVISGIGEGTGVNIMRVVKGTSINHDRDVLRRGGVHVLIGTPGRILDYVSKGFVRVEGLKMFILDEADAMLSAGLSVQVRSILEGGGRGSGVPMSMSFVLVSATITPDVLAITKEFMPDSINLLVKPEELPLARLQQFQVDVGGTYREKLTALEDIYSRLNGKQAFIFVNSTAQAKKLAADLVQSDFSVALSHGLLTAEERMAALHSFRECRVRLLVTTDVLGKGIDVPAVSIVFNFDVPSDDAIYIQRIGRACRGDRVGSAVTLVGGQFEATCVRGFEGVFKWPIKPLPRDLSSV